MPNLGAIRSQTLSLIRETTGDTNFTSDQLNAFINQAQKLMVPIIGKPRKDYSVQVAVGDVDYDVPSDFVRMNMAYFGDLSLANDVRPLQFVTEDTLRSLFPSWRSTHSTNRGVPSYVFMIDDNTVGIYPPPNSDNSATGKKLIYSYLYYPVDLSSDSDEPVLPLPYQDILKYYAAHLCYLNLSNQDMAATMLKEFAEHHKQIQQNSIIESNEALGWQWAYDDGVNDDSPNGTAFLRI
jgi:hypothetical protein